MSDQTDVVYAVIDGFVEGGVQLRQGEIWAADDALVRAYPQHFTADGSRFARNTRPKDVFGNDVGGARIEAATAAPGERRSVNPGGTAGKATRSRGTGTTARG